MDSAGDLVYPVILRRTDIHIAKLAKFRRYDSPFPNKSQPCQDQLVQGNKSRKNLTLFKLTCTFERMEQEGLNNYTV